MRVNLYSVNHADDSLSVEAENVTLESYFPDDPQDMANVAAEIEARGSHSTAAVLPLYSNSSRCETDDYGFLHGI
jgi:hypothetical protein